MSHDELPDAIFGIPNHIIDLDPKHYTFNQLFPDFHPSMPNHAHNYIALCAKRGITLTYFHAVKAGPSGVLTHRFQTDGHSMDLPAEHTPEELCAIVRDRLAEFDRRCK